ncbi:PREDICTED: kinesin-like protein KIF28P isoform X2 [Amphimedon queenslandica]|uniref:Kinesin motor domain-containing protein n=1 Tax=Amphimedon queenslandica TaxID=400682 RepID=A0AAN0JL39_AMPQE|nr:PREDICTED: kinesin-like protein KIF28P isoform X2 [Amphimedon queenslandica]|eukprot:XP_019857435.1 PREDICTED: kinesin-like protein KIF28P isoform X2 [Amphimedon queenslandica]
MARVVIREEIEKQTPVIIRNSGQVITLRNPLEDSETKSFQFDYTYGLSKDDNGYLQPAAQAEQKQILTDLVPRLLRNAWKGYNCALIAYGQRGTGKSVSIFGNKSYQGAISAVCDKLFDQIPLAKDTLCQVSISMMEVYNNEVRDLMSNNVQESTLKVRENKRIGYYVDGLKVLAVATVSDIERILKEGKRNRALLSTEMNSLSTHSSTVLFQLKFVQKCLKKSGQIINKSSIINFVDLPATGAESGVVNESLEKNLSVFHSVVEALIDNKEAKVPFNDSTLTKLLKPVLSGHSKITLIANISPIDSDYNRTMTVLKFAEQFRKIVLNAGVNESVTDEVIQKLREENAELLSELRNEENLVLKYSDPKEFQKIMEKRKKEIYRIIRSNEEEIDELKQTWEDKLLITLQKMLKVAELREAAFEQDKETVPYLWNLHEDPQLTGSIVHLLQPILSYTIGRQTDDNEDKSDITLNGLSIQRTHAVITNEGRDGAVSLSPCTSSKVLVNGRLVDKPITLHHNDRITFGCHHLYVLNHPREMKSLPATNKPVAITYLQAIEDIAISSGYTTESDDNIKKEVFRLIPMVHEANIISEELDKRLSFEIVSLPLKARGGKRETKVMIQKKQLVTGKMSLWSVECFCSRYIAMKDIYQKQVKEYDLILSNDEDPFWEPDCNEALMGQAYVYMQYLPYMVQMEDTVTISDLDGHKIGQLNVHVLPHKPNPIQPLDDNSSIENTDDTLGKRIQFQFKIKNAVGLPERAKKGVFCKFHFFLDVNESVTKTIAETVSPNFNYMKEVTIDPVTPSTLYSLRNEPLLIELWTKETQVEKWEPSSVEEEMKVTMDTKELMRHERQTRGCPVVIKVLQRQTVKIESEVMKYELATMKAKVNHLEASVKRVEDLITKAEEKNDDKILLIDLQKAVKNILKNE